MATAAEELAKQVLGTLEGLEGRMAAVLQELPPESREDWCGRFRDEAERLARLARPQKAP